MRLIQGRNQHLGGTPAAAPCVAGAGDTGAAAFPVRRRGHRLQRAVGPFGGYQAIMWDATNGVYVKASESRKDGQAAGY